MDNKFNFFRNALLRWFSSNNRELPWRLNYDPYHVWLSEIMLQQTQMERGVAYFQRWLQRFPDIDSIATADPQEILKYWEGLGYYARARNLYKAAKTIVDEFDGEIPSNYDDLLRLPGVGPYTASAILSIAFNYNIPVVDANVERVFSRIFDIDEPLKERGVHEKIKRMAEKLLPEGKARQFNQALMDLGGLICTPRKPQCGLCPISKECLAYLGNFVIDRPVKVAKQQTITIEMATGLILKNGYVFIQQRRDDDIWGGLWEFPGGRLKEGESPSDAVVREYKEETGFKVKVRRKITTVIHFFTKYKVILHCYQCLLDQDSILPDLNAAQKFHWIKEAQLDSYGFPAGHRKYIGYIRQHCPEILFRDC